MTTLKSTLLARTTITAGKTFTASALIQAGQLQAIIASDIDPTDAADPTKNLHLTIEVSSDNFQSSLTIADISWQGYPNPPWKGTTRDIAITIDLQPYWGMRIRATLQSDSGVSSGASVTVIT